MLRCEPPEPIILDRRPGPPMPRQPPLPGARGNRSRRAAWEPVGDPAACQTLRVAIANDRVLRGRPALPRRRAMQAERLGTKAHGARATPEPLGELADPRPA